MKWRRVSYVCRWFTALPSQLLLNCLTRVLVSASLWRMDERTTLSHVRPRVCLLSCIVFLHPSSSSSSSSCSLTPSASALNHPTVCASVCAFSEFLFSPSRRFLPLVCAVARLQEQHVAGAEKEKKATVRRGEKKAHWQKSSFPRSLHVVSYWKKKEKTSITTVIHNSEDVASVEMNCAARLNVDFCVRWCLFCAYGLQ